MFHREMIRSMAHPLLAPWSREANLLAKDVNRNMTTRKAQTGATLVEAMVAMLLLSIGSLALVSGLISTKGLQTHAVKINEAAKVSNGMLESFRKMGYIVLEDAVPAGSYRMESLSEVYGSDATVYRLLDANLIMDSRFRLTQRELREWIHVEHGTESIRVTVEIFSRTAAANDPPVTTMAAFIAKNGINFR